MSLTDKRTLKFTDNELNIIVRSIDEMLSTKGCPLSPEFIEFMKSVRAKIDSSRKVDFSVSTVELAVNEAFSICGLIFAIEDRKWAKGYVDVRNKIEKAFLDKPIDRANLIR